MAYLRWSGGRRAGCPTRRFPLGKLRQRTDRESDACSRSMPPASPRVREETHRPDELTRAAVCSACLVVLARAPGRRRSRVRQFFSATANERANVANRQVRDDAGSTSRLRCSRRGTNHAWANHSTNRARVAFVLIDATSLGIGPSRYRRCQRALKRPLSLMRGLEPRIHYPGFNVSVNRKRGRHGPVTVAAARCWRFRAAISHMPGRCLPVQAS